MVHGPARQKLRLHIFSRPSKHASPFLFHLKTQADPETKTLWVSSPRKWTMAKISVIIMPFGLCNTPTPLKELSNNHTIFKQKIQYVLQLNIRSLCHSKLAAGFCYLLSWLLQYCQVKEAESRFPHFTSQHCGLWESVIPVCYNCPSGLRKPVKPLEHNTL
jgi:hypothetical protein